MRDIMKNGLTMITKWLLDFMFFGGILVTATVPLLFYWYGKYFNSWFVKYYIQLCILFILSGIFAVLIIKELRKMFKTVLADDCFVRENVISLKKMGTYSFFIGIITACRLPLYITPAAMVVVLVFIIAGLFSKVLSQVFDKAVSYKLENDLTI